MIAFTLPEKLNGATLIKEFAAAKINIGIPAVRDGFLWLDIAEKDKTTAETIVANHNGEDINPTFEDKLANAGISLDELRAALGL